MKKFLVTLVLLSFFINVDAQSVVVEENSPVVKGRYLSQNIGIETYGGVFTQLLKSGCKLPCELKQVFSTVVDNQKQLIITMYRGHKKFVLNATSLGKFKISGIVPAKRLVPRIQVTFRVSKGSIWLLVSDLHNVSKLKLERVK